MGIKWQTAEIGNLPIHIGDGNYSNKYPKSSDFISEGIPFISAGDFSRNRIHSTNFRFISYEQHATLLKGQLKANDVLVVTRGNGVGQVAWVDETYQNCNINAQLALLRADEKTLHAKFLFYLLSSNEFQRLLVSFSSGSAQPQLPIKALKLIPIRFPEYSEQINIAKVLDVFDSKIEANHVTNQTLEQMAQALFKSWFVDFDPVFDNLLASVDFKLENLENRLPDELKQKAHRRLAALNSLHNAAECKASLIALVHELQANLPTQAATQSAVQILGKTAETPVKVNLNTNPNILAQHANTHAYFPSEFEHNEQLGWIPKGWESKTIDELCKINPESWTKKNAPEVVKYVDLANAKNGSVGEAIEYSFSEAPSRARRILRPHDTIIGVVRPANRSFAYVNEDNLTGSTGFAVVRANNQNCRAFAYFSLTNDDCIQEFTRIADGAAYPAIKPEDVAKTYCVYSNNKILDAFESIAGNIMSGVARNQTQTKTLTKLSDTLLPKLIAGEITINKDI